MTTSRKDRWKAAINAHGYATVQKLFAMSPEERQRALAQIKGGELPKTYDQGWSEGRAFERALIGLHLHARGFCEAAKAIEAPGFFGSFGMAGGDGFSEEVFLRDHACFKEVKP